MKKFILAIQQQESIQYMYITIDQNHNDDENFFLELMKSSFPTMSEINKMLLGSNDMNTKKYSVLSIDELKETQKKNKVAEFIVYYNNGWTLQ